MPFRRRLSVHLLFFALSTVLIGCGPQSSTGPAEPVEPPATADLQQILDETLQFTYQRRLSIEEHAAWQILHGVLAYQQAFQVEHDGQLISAVDYLLKGGKMNGFDMEVVETDDTPALRALLEEGSKAGQGHADQWLAVLAQAGVSLDQNIQWEGRPYKMADLVRQVQADVYRNPHREYSWTLIALTSYLPTSSAWTAGDGSTWSIEKLLEIELEHELAASACGGTHRLIGMAMALQRHVDQGGDLSGAWAAAENVIAQAVARAKELQNPDGSFSTQYFVRPGTSPDFGENLGTTGHVLEFLAIALPPAQLQEPWVRRAVMHLCDLFRKTKSIPLECGKLYHAAHGLVLYRERVFGPYQPLQRDSR